MIELRNYKRNAHACISRTRDLVYKRTRIRAGGGGGCAYEIKTLRSNLAPEEGGGVYSRGAYNRASTVYATGQRRYLAYCMESGSSPLSANGGLTLHLQYSSEVS